MKTETVFTSAVLTGLAYFFVVSIGSAILAVSLLYPSCILACQVLMTLGLAVMFGRSMLFSSNLSSCSIKCLIIFRNKSAQSTSDHDGLFSSKYFDF